MIYFFYPSRLALSAATKTATEDLMFENKLVPIGFLNISYCKLLRLFLLVFFKISQNNLNKE